MGADVGGASRCGAVVKRRRRQACQCSATAAAFVVGMHDESEMVAYIEVCAEHAAEVAGMLPHFGFDVEGVFDMAAQDMWLREVESFLGQPPEKLHLASVA